VTAEPVISGHPALAGRESEMHGLSEAVRRLIALTVTTGSDREVLREVTAGLEKLSDRLAADVPEKRFPRFVGRDTQVAVSDLGGVVREMPFDVVVGRMNPLALPVVLEADPPNARGRATYTIAYEGAPGCVHGAAIASAFDLVLTAANLVAGAAGPTVRLALVFRRPTLLGVECLYEAEVTSRTEKRIFTEGRLIQNGKVAVEATGEFATLDLEQIAALHKR
jgi:acyl-coenzyme A thioesterase PaaI-like protein